MEIRTPDIPTALEPAAELDQLGDEIAELSAHIEAATAHLLDLIREFDARGGWNTGFRSCAAWLAWRVGLDPGAARERVRVAHALGTLPLLARALARGELSYAKVRALTRVATPETEGRLLALGRAGTAAHVERIVRGWRRVDRQAEARETARRHESRALDVYQGEDGMVVLRGRLAPEVGALLVQALAAAREALYQQQQADALALLAETALRQTRRRASVPAPGRAAPARGAASCCDTLRSRPGPAGRHEAQGSAFTRGRRSLAGRAPGRGLGHRRHASVGGVGTMGDNRGSSKEEGNGRGLTTP